MVVWKHSIFKGLGSPHLWGYVLIGGTLLFGFILEVSIFKGCGSPHKGESEQSCLSQGEVANLCNSPMGIKGMASNHQLRHLAKVLLRGACRS